MKEGVKRFIKFYQSHQPERLANICIYTPSCSNYMMLAIDKYGLIKGIYKGVKRILRCNRKYQGGIDYP